MAHQKKLAISALVMMMSMLALATASSYTTTITTTTFNEEGREWEQRCRQQVQEQGRARLHNCERYLSSSQSRHHGGGRYDRGEDLVVENPYEGQEEQSLRQCCQELRNFDEECQCEAIKQVAQRAQQEQQQGQGIFGGRGQSEQVYEKARELPRRCNLRMEQCSFRLVFV